MSGKILPLSEAVRSKLRSGVTITCLAQCVEELVLNSVDAKATCIAVRVDPSIFRIQVVDNGEGVTEDNLTLIGKRHATSKCHSLEDLNSNLGHYGFRGEALASLVDVSAIVDITTRPRGSMKTISKVFMYGKEKSVSTAKVTRPSIGTTITVQDFMYNMPVRRKLMKETIDIENIRARLESFALMHPKISFSLRNDNSQTKVMHTNKSNSTLSTFMQLFGLEKCQGLVEVEHAVDQFTVSGYISTQAHLTKALQYIYVNKRVVLKTKIHKMMNYLLDHTSIISKRLHPTTPLSGKQPSSPPKCMKLHGIYVINVECPLKEYDICMDPTKTLVEFRDWNKLLLCIEEMVINFAKEERLTISLDDRYRRSGRDQVPEEEDKQEEPHSSQALLQIFSLKRSAEDTSTRDGSREKYGRTLCAHDNLAAVHSLPVRRKRNKSHEIYVEVNSDDDEVVSKNGRYEEDTSNLTEETQEEEKNEETKLVEKSDVASSPSKNLLQRLQYLRSPEKRQESLNKVRSSLEMFKRAIMQDEGETSIDHPPTKERSPEAAPRIETESLEEGVNNKEQSIGRRSSLQDFIDYYKEDLAKSKEEACETPKELILLPPVEPPPLRRPSSPVNSTQEASQEDSADSRRECTLQEKGQKEKRSLSKALSEGWRRHQSKSSSLKALQKFEFQKKSSEESALSFSNKELNFPNTGKRQKTTTQSLTKKDELAPPHQSTRQWHQNSRDEAFIQGAENDGSGSVSRKESIGSNDDLESSFRFQPVIASEIKRADYQNSEKPKEETHTFHAAINNAQDSYHEEFSHMEKNSSHDSDQQSDFEETLNPHEKDIEERVSRASESLPQTSIQKGGICQLSSQSFSFEEGSIWTQTHSTLEKNQDLCTKEISPTQPFNIEISTQNINFEGDSRNQTYPDYSSNRLESDPQHSCGFSLATTSTDSINCSKTGRDEHHKNEIVGMPVTSFNHVKSTNIKDLERENTVSITKDSTIEQDSEASQKEVNEIPLHKPLQNDGHVDSEINFVLQDASSSTVSFEENVAESRSIQSEMKYKVNLKCGTATASTITNNRNSIDVMKDHDEGEVGITAVHTSKDTSLQLPLSASLHFSQLTLPSTGDSALTSQHTSSIADTSTAHDSIGLSLPSLSSLGSCSVEGQERSKVKMPSYDIVFHGKVIHIDGRKTHPADGIQEATGKLANVETESSGSDSESLLRKPFERQVSELGELAGPPDASGRKDPNDNNLKRGILDNNIKDKRQLERKLPDTSSLQADQETVLGSVGEEMSSKDGPRNKLQILWKETTDENGKKVYVNLRTGNTSYELPVIKETPEWTSSQPQGAPILKIPVSEEPETEGGQQPQDFTLTHGYSAFMSWKRKRALEKSLTSGKSNTDPVKDAGNARDEEQQKVCINHQASDATVSPGMKEAIQTILQDSEVDDFSIKWSEKPSDLNHTEEKSHASEVNQICQMWEPPNFAMDADILNSGVQPTKFERGASKNSSVKIYNIVEPYKFTRDMLHTSKVIGQLDKKFIVCTILYTSTETSQNTASELVVLFDQHAVDERVRLETITEENWETLESGDRVIRSLMITPPLEMKLPDSEVRLMMAYKRTFIRWGLHFTQVSTSKVNFHSIPSILVAREAHELRQRRCQSATSIIESMVRDICHNLHQTGGIVSAMPKPLFNVMCNQACRGAIKFGDGLSLRECEDLIKALASCTLPFQCAHGRPSVVPAVNMTHLANGRAKEGKPNLHKLREAMLNNAVE